MLFHLKFIFLLLFSIKCIAACTPNIPEEVKKEYAAELQNAFVLQSEGLSTSAMFHFEQGVIKATNAGESLQKIEAIRKLFTWFRTYGYYLSLIKQDPKIIGQYIGHGKYSVSTGRYSHFNSHSHREKSLTEMRTDYLFGTAQIIAGILCVAFLPSCPAKYVLGVSLTTQGFTRIYDSVKPLLFKEDIPIVELQKVGETIKASAL